MPRANGSGHPYTAFNILKKQWLCSPLYAILDLIVGFLLYGLANLIWPYGFREGRRIWVINMRVY